MKQARDFQELQRNLNNDSFYECVRLFQSLSGISISARLNSDKHWPVFAEVIAAMSDVTHLLTYAFGYLDMTFRPTDKPSNSHVRFLREWLAQKPDASENQFSRRLAILFLEDIETEMPWAKTEGTFREFGIFRIYPKASSEEDTVSEEQSQVFISYKHARYFKLANQLFDQLTGKGLVCWLDREKLGLREGDWIDPRILKKKLKGALQSARCTVFFETYHLATADSDFRAENLVFNWQEFEQRFANNLIVVRPEQYLIYEGTSENSTAFTGIESLAQLIIDRLPTYERHVGVLPHSIKGADRLKDSIATLRKMAEKYFGREIVISPRTALILLAPADIRSYSESIYSDDLLINLVRYSPFCAFEMMKAGLDIVSLMRVGVKLRSSDWSPPNNSCLFPDFLGGDVSGRAEIARQITTGGYLDERLVLAGLLQFSCLGQTFIDPLLTKTFNLMRGKPHDDAAGHEIETLRDWIIDSLGRENHRFIDQQWMLCPDGDRLCLSPIACCGVFRISDFGSDQAVLVRLHVAQINTFFSLPIFREFEELLNTNPKKADLEAFFAGSDELQATMAFSGPIYRTHVFGTAATEGMPEHFFLEPVTARESPPEIETSGSFAVKLLDVITDLRREPAACPSVSLNHPLDFNSRRSAIIIGTPVEARQSPTISLMDFHLTVLAPLWEYQQVRNLEYDDI